ncbi:TPA: phage tail family protein [Streptococcus agalactiae]|nr:phage tail family protein [Streptococcus agalactiae]HEO6206036.1 phage tail family protein [Streptococcus agalactiae]
MKFDGIDLSNVIEIHDIKRDVGNTRNVVSSSALKIGEHVQSVHVGAKKISVDFSIWTRNRNEVKHNLAKIFNRTTPRKLFFSDEPDKYYMAIVVDDIPMVEDVIKRSMGTITFLIPDGVAHSTTYKKFLDYTKDGNKLTFKLKNEGNTNAFPIIKIKHNSENGYIGIANETGAFALGSVEEEDGTIVHRNEVLFDYSKAIAQALEGAPNVAKLNHMPPTYDTELKRMRFDNILGSGKGGEYVAIGNRGTTPGYTEHVGTRTFIINPDSNGEYTLNEHLWWQQIFIATAQDQKGFLKLCVTGIDDEGNDEFLYGIETYKRKNGFEAEYNFFALDDDGVGWRFYKQFEFQADRNYHNPFSMDRSRAVEIFREEDKFRIYFNGAHHHVTVPSLKGKKSRKIHLAMGTCSDSSKYINYNLFEKVNFEKMGVSHYNNIVNKYQPGDEVIINFENDTVKTKDLDSIQDMVLGSQLISIPPGKTELVMQVSKFSQSAPNVEILMEERWL